MRYLLHVTHYAPNGSDAWCGRTVGFHAALPATKDPERVTCKNCLKAMRTRERRG